MNLWVTFYDFVSFSSGNSVASPKMARTFMRIIIIPTIRLLHVIMEMLEKPKSQGERKIHIPKISWV